MIFILALLTGCATTGVRPDVAPDLKESALLLFPVTDRALFTATGVSFMAISLNGERHLLTVNKWPQDIPKNEGRGKRFFGVFTLPPGEYKLVYWYLIQTEGGAAPEPKDPFIFKLNKSDVVYIGNFNVIRILDNGQFRDRFDEDVKQYISLFPWLKNFTIKHEQLKSIWWPLPGGEDPEEVLHNALLLNPK